MRACLAARQPAVAAVGLPAVAPRPHRIEHVDECITDQAADVSCVQGREHLEFIMALGELLPSREALLDQLAGCMEAAGFQLQEASLVEAEAALARNQLCGTRVLDPATYL